MEIKIITLWLCLCIVAGFIMTMYLIFNSPKSKGYLNMRNLPLPINNELYENIFSILMGINVIEFILLILICASKNG